MNFLAFLAALLNGYKTYSAVILMIASGLAELLARHYDSGLQTLFEAAKLISAGGAVASLRQAVGKPSDVPAK